ncbi:IPT/TIG domain-containing protein [Tieghemostelium lacteum]|uniref:IPT/TIG domain-containing protein n=1 Tax=Tieghemostelium lacteum TaxID=361077 RepID=A0A151ZAE5_TIELA|nr:IPT/TIG domain-containing protein [Tieghemostelium lacteum]|eukprot:KYQ90921.1 IPT/TIG domain-containing protein [Tieghemostelium lacteum]
MSFPRSTSSNDFKSSSSGVNAIQSQPQVMMNNSNSGVKISSPVVTGNSIVATTATNVIALGAQLNQEEEQMNLPQLLACFPEPPTFSLINRANQQRKDTIYSFVSQPSLQSKQSAIPDAKLNQIIQVTTEQQLSPDKIIINDMNKLERSHSVSLHQSPILPLISDTNSESSTSSSNRDRLVESNTSENLLNQLDDNSLPTLPKEFSTNSGGNSSTSTSPTPTSQSNSSTPNSMVSQTPNTASLTPSPISSPVTTSTNNSPPTVTISNTQQPTQIKQQQQQQYQSSPNSERHQTLMLPNQNYPTQSQYNNNSKQGPSSSSSNNQQDSKRVTISFGNFPKSNSSPTMSSQNNGFYQTPKWDINLNQLQNSSHSTGSLESQNNPHNVSYDLYLKACKNELLPIEFNRVLYGLLENKPTDTIAQLEKIYEQLSSSNSSSGSSSSSSSSSSGKQNITKSFLTAVKSVVGDETPSLKFSKIILYFGHSERTVAVNQDFSEDLLLTNTSGKKLKFKVNLGAINKDFTVTSSVKDGVINKKSNTYITFTINLKTSMKMRKIITIDVEGGYRYFILIQVESGKTAFGQDIEKEELIDDGGYNIPKPLYYLKQFLVDNKGLHSESLFRQPPTSNQELYQIKEQFSKDPLNLKCQDINIIATLIKMYFRELPQCLLNGISHKTFLENDFVGDETLLFVNQISDIKRTTFLWLINLLADVSKNEHLTKMNSKNLAIIFAPNLYITPQGLSPEDSIAISGKVINFILQMMNLVKNIEL